MANPLISQGTLNRLRASIQIPDFPELNVTAPYVGDEGISLSLQGDSTTYINTLTGAVTSPEPYMLAQVSLHLLKSQSLANLYKAQMEDDSRIGNVIVRPDVTTLDPYQLINCAIQSVGQLTLNGRDAGFRVTITGYYVLNGVLFNGA